VIHTSKTKEQEYLLQTSKTDKPRLQWAGLAFVICGYGDWALSWGRVTCRTAAFLSITSMSD